MFWDVLLHSLNKKGGCSGNLPFVIVKFPQIPRGVFDRNHEYFLKH